MTRRQRSLAARAVVLVATLALVVAGASPGSAAQPSRAQETAQAARPLAAQGGVIQPRLACASLNLDLTRPQPGVPDFTTVPGAPTRITSATLVAATPQSAEVCDVKGYVAPQIQFDLRLPTRTWQGRYLQFGCGGFCGVVLPSSSPPCDLQPGGDFVTATTDDGHSAGAADGLWGANDGQLRQDFGNRAPHVVSIAARAIMTAFYGRGPRFSYFQGCSDGGHEALMEAERYPADFDGIIAGAPANIWAPLLGELETWLAAANTDGSGNQILTPDKLPALHAAVLAACDGKDGLVDGQIDDPRACTFDPGTLRCAGADGPACLTPPQVATVRKLYQGPVDAHGRRLYPAGEPYGSELAWLGWIVTPGGTQSAAAGLGDNYLKYLGFPIGQPASSLATWKFTVAGFDRLRAMGPVYNSASADLSAFRKRGGKLLIYHGWADQAIPPVGTVAYYQALRDRFGGLASTESFARLFMVPSMYHCGGGYGPDVFDTIDPITHWVEQGTAPERIVASETNAGGAVIRTRPLFPYPEQARYTGTGSIDDAANFVGGLPRPLPDDHVRWVGNDLFGE